MTSFGVGSERLRSGAALFGAIVGTIIWECEGSKSKLSDVILEEITKENWQECMNLRLSTDQGGLIAPYLYSITSSDVEASFMPLAIYHGDQMVGFVMYGVDPDDGEHWISRLMIDEKHQGNGYGKAAMIEVLRQLKEMGVRQVFMGYKPPNVIAQSLLHSLGFERTGQMLQGEFIARLDLEHTDF